MARLAVPFFFCCTGYFIKEEGITNSQVVFSYIRKLLNIYFVWSLVYIPVQLIQMIGTHTFDCKNLLNYLKFFVVQGSFIHLWYLPAIMLSLGILHFLIKNFTTPQIIVFVLVLYLIGMLGDGYYGILQFLPHWVGSAMEAYEDLFITTRNGLFFGIPFVFIGMMIAKYESYLLKIKFYPWLLLSLIGICIETYFLDHFSLAIDYNMTLFIVPTTLFLFCVLLQIPWKLNNKCQYLRKYSTLIYESHLLFYGLILALLSIFDLPLLHISGIQFIITLGLSHLFSFLVIHLAQQYEAKRPT